MVASLQGRQVGKGGTSTVEAVAEQRDWVQMSSVWIQTLGGWVESAVCSEAAPAKTEAAERGSWGAVARQHQWRLWRVDLCYSELWIVRSSETATANYRYEL
jgi:hypothetical protein